MERGIDTGHKGLMTGVTPRIWAIWDSDLASAEDNDAAVKGTLGLSVAYVGPLQIAAFAELDTWERIFVTRLQKT